MFIRLTSSRGLIIRICGLRESFEEGTGTGLVKEAEGASKEGRKEGRKKERRSEIWAELPGIEPFGDFFSLVSKIHSWSRIFLPSGLCFGAHSSAFFFPLQFPTLDAGSRPG